MRSNETKVLSTLLNIHGSRVEIEQEPYLMESNLYMRMIVAEDNSYSNEPER